MRHPLITFIELIYPFLISVGLIGLMPFVKLDQRHNAILSVPLLRVNFTLPIHSLLIVRILLGIIALFSLMLPAFKDYSSFFPTHYDMVAFFDNEGIEKALEDYTQDELKTLNIAEDWRQQKAKYLRRLTADISKNIGIDDFFNQGEDNVHSSGHTNFVVEKVEGWQTYNIREAVGELEHRLELPMKEDQKFYSGFELLNTPDNFIRASLSDIYFHWTKILKPHFKQIAKLNSTGNKILYHHNLIACIKIRFFPIATIGNTIYFVRHDQENTWIPIGYAMYKPSK